MIRILRPGAWLLLLLQSACGGVEPAGAFQITVEQGGGFTGLYSGYALYSGGRIERWEQLPGGIVEVEWSDSVTAAEAEELSRRLLVVGAEWRSDRQGNMTSRVTLVADDSTGTWSWEGTGEPPAPPAFVDWYRDLRELCRAVGERRADAGL